MDRLLIDQVGHVECLLGNEAIVRGALEAGVCFASGYPGTPSSEITDTFARIAGPLGIAFEYSVNEKIAIEMAFAASLAGARSICAMKHLGLMSGGDPFSTIPYVGVEAGMVVVSAADPSCRTSPNEQDQRHLGAMLHVPVLDPSTPADALAMTRFAFELSEKSRLPVLLRPTTRVCHSRASVEYGALAERRVGGFVRNPSRYVPIPANARRMRGELRGRLATAEKMMAESGFFRRTGTSPVVVLAAGAPAATCADLLVDLGASDRVSLWTLGTIHPLPEAELVKHLRGVECVLVVEELSALVEDKLSALVSRHGLHVEILGKRTGHLPEEGEYEPAIIERALHDALGIGTPRTRPAPASLPQVAARPPSLCPGCPHRAAFFAARAAFGEDQLYFNDIGCYTLGYGPPLDAADALLCMGAGFTLAAGVARVTGKRTIGFMGDSTFFHSGMPALLDAVKERANVVAVILDNQITAMTGFQDSPTTLGGGGDERASIPAVVRALGAKHVEIIDPYDLERSIAAFGRARDASGVSVVIVERACPVHKARVEPQVSTEASTRRPAFVIDPDRCRTCGREAQGLRCGQCMTEGYERQLVRSHAVQHRDPGTTRPETAPCSDACPLALCIDGYVTHIAAGEYAEALGHVLERTALPESVCRVCHRPCEARCVRADVDAPLAINDLKRFVVDWAAAQPVYPNVRKPEPASGKKVAVVGAGPSGLAAAHDLVLRGHHVTLYDAAKSPGGILAHHIPTYRLPPEALERDIRHVLEAGVRFVGETRLGRDITLDELLASKVDAIYLAVGAWRSRRLAIPGAGAPGTPAIQDALGWLQAVRAGTAAEGSDGQVLVIGGGNAAIDAARTLRRKGAGRVTVACIETRAKMPALREEIVAAEAEGIVLRPELVPIRIVPGAVCFSHADGSESRIETDSVVTAIGQEPELGFLVDAPALERAADGCLVVDRETARTSHERIWAGGDVVQGERSVTAAMAWGLRAAWSIDRELRGEKLADRRPPPPHPRSGAVPLEVRTAPAERREPRTLPMAVRTRSFDEIVAGLGEDDARAEAARCLDCGRCGNCRGCVDLFGCPALGMRGDRVVIDPALCNGCGVCADFCPNDAILPGATA